MRRTQNSIIPSQSIAHLRPRPERNEEDVRGEGERERKKKERKESKGMFYFGRPGSRLFFIIMFVSYPRRRAPWTLGVGRFHFRGRFLVLLPFFIIILFYRSQEQH